MADNKPEERQAQGWADVTITDQMPLNILVNFMNVLNQRLCTLENIVTTMHNGKAISLTDLYALQAAEAAIEQKLQDEMPIPEDAKGE